MQTQSTQMAGHRLYKQDANNMLKRTKDQLGEREIELKNTLRREDDGGGLVTAEKLEILLNDLRQET